jgi:hypothetical protein
MHRKSCLIQFLQFERFASPCLHDGWVSGFPTSRCSSLSRSLEEQVSRSQSRSYEAKSEKNALGEFRLQREFKTGGSDSRVDIRLVLLNVSAITER